MSSIKEILVNDVVYHLAEDIVAMHPKEFKESKRSPRQMIEYKRIPEDSYLYMVLSDNEWKQSNKKYLRSKALIKKEWLESFLTKKEQKQEQIKVEKTTTEIQELPPLLELTDEEKFKDENGEVMEIETRGERKEDKCYFRVKDVSIYLQDPKLIENIIRSISSYEKFIDYIYFYSPSPRGITESVNTNQNENRKTDGIDSVLTIQNDNKTTEMYFTYNGILRCFYVSRNPNTKRFRQWKKPIAENV